MGLDVDPAIRDTPRCDWQKLSRGLGESCEGPFVPGYPLGVPRRGSQPKVVRQVLSEVCDLHTACDLVRSHTPDVLVVGLVGAMAESVDSGDDLGRVTRAHEVPKLELGVLDHVVEYSDDLVGRFTKRQHDPQRVEDVGLALRGGIALPAMSTSG
jgi:hypothetical protein